MSTTTTTKAEVTTSPKLQELPGLESLGCGYDATEYYASPRSSRNRIFELGPKDTEIRAPNNKSYAKPANLEVELGDLTAGEFQCIKGQSAEEYRSSMTSRAGVSASYGLFSVDVKRSYKEEQLASFNRDFVSVYHRFDAWVLSLPNYRALRMNEQAKREINTDLSPDDVIRDYGTHVLMRAIFGGRAEYNCLVDKSKYTSSVEVTEAAKAAYAGTLNISTSFEQETKNAAEQFKSSSSYNFRTRGGNFDTKFNPESYEQWMDSFSNHPVMVDFGGRNSLVPIYELASERNRKNELKAAYEKYIQESQNMIPDNFPAIEVRKVSQGAWTLVATDQGSHSKTNVGIWKPLIDGNSEWRWIGHASDPHQMVIIKSLVPGATAAPMGFRRMWTDAGSGNGSGYSLWNIIPPPGYKALGGIAKFRVGRSDYDTPSGDLVDKLVCVHESLCTEGRVGNFIWNDHGTKADSDGSMWYIEPNDGNGIRTGAFICSGNHDKFGEQVYVIKKGNNVRNK